MNSHSFVCMIPIKDQTKRKANYLKSIFLCSAHVCLCVVLFYPQLSEKFELILFLNEPSDHAILRRSKKLHELVLSGGWYVFYFYHIPFTFDIFKPYNLLVHNKALNYLIFNFMKTQRPGLLCVCNSAFLHTHRLLCSWLLDHMLFFITRNMTFK